MVRRYSSSLKKQDLKKKVGNYERHDAYYHAAKKQGFVARSIFKLEEIDQDFKLISVDDYVLDLGCAPGSWLQYVEKRISKGKGCAVGIDLLPAKVSFGEHVRIVRGDIYEAQLEDLLPPFSAKTGFDVVLSDMAPNTTGIRSVDQDRSMALCERALDVAEQMLTKGGKFCVKILEGGDMKAFLERCRSIFTTVKVRRPKGTRSTSIETYIIGLGKKL